MLLMLSGCRTPWPRLGSPAVAAKPPGVPTATASWPGVIAMSTWETLKAGEVNPAVSSMVEAPAVLGRLPTAALCCWEMTRNHVTANAEVYAALTSESQM